jgi:hypothetical protein
MYKHSLLLEFERPPTLFATLAFIRMQRKRMLDKEALDYVL